MMLRTWHREFEIPPTHIPSTHTRKSGFNQLFAAVHHDAAQRHCGGVLVLSKCMSPEIFRLFPWRRVMLVSHYSVRRNTSNLVADCSHQ
jgi:hypothetical protein